MITAIDVDYINRTTFGCTITTGLRWDEKSGRYECMDAGEWFDSWPAAIEHFTPEWLFEDQLYAWSSCLPDALTGKPE